jgi:4-hydroxy-tetrahydrodipicolinate synthase
MALNLPLRGVIPALVTPFTADGNIDAEALREIVDFHLKQNVSGFFVCGTTGLGPAMSTEEREKVAEIVIQAVHGKVPLIVQVGSVDPHASIELAKHAQAAGADAVASLTPFYYKPGDDAMIEYYTRLAESTTLPLFIYNIPRNTGNNVDANLLLKLSKIRNIVGVKDSSQDFNQLIDYLATLPRSFNVIVGTDSFLYSALHAGAHGGVSALANAFPETMLEIYQAYVRKDTKRGAELQRRVHALRSVVSSPPIAPILEVLRLRGLRSGHVRPPLRSMTPKEIEGLRSTVQRILPQLKLVS